LKASRLFPGALAADAVAKLQAAKAAAMARLAAPRVEKCPICGGAKKVAVAAEKASRAKSNSGVRRIEDEAVSKTSPQASAQCRFCRGLGRLARVRDREAVAEDLRLGTAAFSRLAEADGRCKALGVWWNAADAVALKAAKGSSASRAANDREDECRKCAGIGTVRCPECSGWGRVRCKAAVHGAAGHSGNAEGDSTIEASLLGSSEAASARCRECGGKASDAGFTSCGACGGRGFAACRACDGSGRSR
ncbi:MAG: hypothetical protein IJS46_01365, partial [Kiritimatiellae bacterium]|nr:hypothetical protein [Kiritimatiellia bacterium]